MKQSVVIILCVLGAVMEVAEMDSVRIDSQLASVSSDCFERIAIGQRLISSDVLRSVKSQQVKDCEKECDVDLDNCSSFDFGISHQGNGTCNLSPKLPPRSGTLVEDPDYDVYVKKQECRYVEPTPPSYPSLPKPADSCFRKVLTGKRLAEQHIRKSLPSQSAELCQEECSTERNFVCEGFNYRVDVGGFGRGSCELTDAPSSRLDLGRDFFPDRDYDFYERDRNSGPDCNVPSKGGLYGGSKPYGHYYVSGGTTHRYDSWGGGRRPSYGGGRRDNFIGSPSHGPWGTSGGGNLYGNGNYYGGSGSPSGSYGSGGGYYGGGGGSHGSSGSWGGGWRGSGNPPPGQQNSRGGQGSWYWNRPPVGWNGNREIGFHSHGSAPPFGYREECFVRSRTGFRLDRRVLKVVITVPSLHDCEMQCIKEGHFVCNTFSFRYSLEPSFPHENCHMSDRFYNDLDPYHDLLPDRDYDIYSKNEYARSCQEDLPQRRPHDDSECFVRVRSGQSLDHSVVKDRLNMPSVGECELACLRSRYFTCRVFSYRYGAPAIGAMLDNCLLSDWPFLELDPRRQLEDDLGYELYERGSYGHGCEINHYTPYPEKQYEFDHRHQYHEGGIAGGHPPPLQPAPRPPAYPKPGDNRCYVAYGGPAQLLPSVVLSSLDVPTEWDCKAECTRARDSFNFFCTALSFRPGNAHHTNTHYDENVPQHNCLLSDVEQRDLRPGLDYVHDRDNWMFAWNFLDPQCDLTAHNPEQHGFDGHYIPGRPDVQTWQRFTVSGRPCRYGTQCIENREAGFWYCDLEGGDAGAWDYCCRPGHQCGYSEGHNYPWCYVGSAARDQWRPCSDHYYPYSHDPHGGPHRPPHGQHQHIDAFHYESYGPPRYWPVAYLHKDAPPNSTTLFSSPGDKDPGSLLSGYSSHVVGGHDNHVGTNRYGYGRKLTWPTPDNTTGSATVIKIDSDKSKDKNMNDKMDPLLLLVDDHDSSGVETAKDHKLTGMSETEIPTTTTSPAGITKLQPRFVTLREQDHKLSKLVARDTVPGEIKQWSWRRNKEDDEAVMKKITPIPVEVRRKMPQESSVTNGGNGTLKTVRFELPVPRATVTKL